MTLKDLEGGAGLSGVREAEGTEMIAIFIKKHL
jgi:hypothetical protein